MTTHSKAIDLALRTWYPKDHKLHLNPHHPLGKLAGEWGELLDDYMKSLYKPGYQFDPINELGDIWYYIRILAYQTNNTLIKVTDDRLLVGPIEVLIAQTMADLSLALISLVLQGDALFGLSINLSYSVLLKVCDSYSLSIDELTASNWEKLKPGSERGEQWMEARVRTGYVTKGKIG